MYERGGRKFLRRIRDDDARYARLHVDADGLVRAGRARPQRLSNAWQVNESINQSLARQGLTRPANHQAHHIVPDEVVRKHPLLRAAYEKGLFQLDDEANLALLARSEADKVAGISEGLPAHLGPHGRYRARVLRAANVVMNDLLERYGTLASVPDDVLRTAALEIRAEAWNILRGWRAIGDFPHRVIPVRLVNRDVPRSKRQLRDGSLRPEVVDDRFAAVQLLQHIDVVDWQQSGFVRSQVNPEKVSHFDKLVPREPPGGLPPLFRVPANVGYLFASVATYEALQAAEIRGVEFQPVYGTSE